MGELPEESPYRPAAGAPRRGPLALLSELRPQGYSVAMNWRAGSERRYIIVITDAPAYPNKETVALGRARDFAAPGEQFVSTVMVGSRDAERFLRELANSGRGQFVDDVGGQSLMAAILLAVLESDQPGALSRSESVAVRE